jgi:type IV pilus assembly protein PilB
MTTRPKLLGRLLVETGQIEQVRLDEALAHASHSGDRLGEALVRLNLVDGEQVAQALALQLGLPYLPPPLTADPEAIRIVRPDLARARCVLPVALAPRSIVVCMADPLDLAAADDLQFQTGRRLQPVVASPEAVLDGIETAYGTDLEELVASLPADLRVGSEVTEPDLERATRTAPVVRLVDRILREAIDARASDIHIEETGDDVRVRFRVDGILHKTLELPAAARRAVLSRVKVLGGMDISVRRRAQDGRIRLVHGGRHLTMRVSTLPVNGGEKAVVRILDSESAPRSLQDLGLSPSDLQQVRRLVARGEGVILSAGPTGSGKSTTLFAALSELDRDSRNVVTLEDPVEYRLPGASQTQVDRPAGLGFPEALRAVLRQDPDVVMVGEIRDRETAEIAMAAALTGHLVLSTIHTTDAPGAVTRLLDMGVPSFLVAGGLSGVVAQRLVRRVCPRCRGRACDDCQGGYSGRTGVFQVLAVTDPIRDEISRGGSSARLRRLAREAGMIGLDADARRAVASGLTTPHEIGRLIHAAAGATRPCGQCEAVVPLGAVGCPSCGARTGRVCSCGERLETAWRYCPWCMRPATPAD